MTPEGMLLVIELLVFGTLLIVVPVKILRWLALSR